MPTPVEETTGAVKSEDWHDPWAEQEADVAAAAEDQAADGLAEQGQEDVQAGQTEGGGAPSQTAAPAPAPQSLSLDDIAAMSTRNERIAALQTSLGVSAAKAAELEPHLLRNDDYTRKSQEREETHRQRMTQIEAQQQRLNEMMASMQNGQTSPAVTPPPNMDSGQYSAWHLANLGTQATIVDYTDYVVASTEARMRAEMTKQLQPLEERTQQATEQQRVERFHAQLTALQGEYPEAKEQRVIEEIANALDADGSPVNAGAVESVFFARYGRQLLAARANLQVQARAAQQQRSAEEPSVIPSGGGEELEDAISTPPSKGVAAVFDEARKAERRNPGWLSREAAKLRERVTR